ncbi:MAG: hypothetical protein IJW78_00265 [Clostridia bacterium]|nr:hypothetical protein [Clostridia bacterium]
MAKQSKFLRFVTSIVTVALLLTCISVPSSVSAAAYSGGSGTRKDPYLIKTADDLYNMRNNLSAYFKLAATIDMSGYKTTSKFFKNGFVPIGDDSTKPFTGSFTCDLGSDGLPLYAILNLSVYNAKGELYNHDFYGTHWHGKQYPGYPDAENSDAPYYYQTALFGNTKGAKLTNIYVLNASVYSSVVGMGSGVYLNGSPDDYVSYSKFMEEQCTAILVARADKSYITHCAVTGSVKGKTSYHAGLVGQAKGVNITNSYADVTIDTGGAYSVGTLAGKLQEGSKVTNSFAVGTMNVPMDGYGRYHFTHGTAGTFIGALLASNVSDCYSSVKVNNKSDAVSFCSNTTNSTVSNCFSYDTFGSSINQSAVYLVGTHKNCYVSNATSGKNEKFTAATPADISKYFVAQDGWAAGDTYPVLKATNVVTDAGIYVPGAEREGNKTSTNNTTAGDNAANANTDTTTDATEGDNTAEDVVVEGEGDAAQQGTQVVETVGEASDKLDTIQIVLIVLLIIMIVSIAAMSVLMVYTTLRTKKAAQGEAEVEVEDDDIIYSNSEGEVTDEE